MLVFRGVTRGAWRAAVAVLAMALALSGAALAAAQDVTTVSVQPANVQIGVGQETTLEIAVRGAANLYALELELTYDSAIVEVVDDEDATPGVQVGLVEGFLKPEFVVQNEADNGSGVVRLAFTQLAPSAAANGDGVVATVRLRGKAAGTSAVSFAEVVLANDEALPVPAGTSPATVVVGDGGPAPVGQPTTTSDSAQTAAEATPTLPAGSGPSTGPGAAATATATAPLTATASPQTTATAPPAEATVSATIVAQAAATGATSAPAGSTAVPATAPALAASPASAASPTMAPAAEATTPAAPAATSDSEAVAEPTVTSTPAILAEAVDPTAAAAPTVSAAVEVPAQSSALGSLWVIAAVVGVLIIGFGIVIALPRGRRGRA